MPPCRNTLRSNQPAGHLLLLGCSDRKRAVKGKLPALELYDGVNFRVLRAFLNEHGWPPGLCIKILSAKYGLIDATDLIETYDQRLDESTARQMNGKVLKALASVGTPTCVFVNLGKDYLRSVEGIERLFPGQQFVYAEGGIGLKMAQMKKWLRSLGGQTASLPGQKAVRSYLYFFPDWDDYVTEPFVHETATADATDAPQKKYAHEIFSAKDTPYDGMLVSLAQIYTGKGTLSRLDPDKAARGDLRKLMKIPERLLLFGDCGAFSYAFEEKPPFSPEEAARLYDRFGFDVGASVDHIPLAEIVVEKDGELVRQSLTEGERRRRMALTTRNADIFLATCRQQKYRFVPFGVIQGMDLRSFVKCVHAYIDMGYQHIALGGLVPRSDSAILEICCAVRGAIQSRTRTEQKNVWLHLFGILRPKIQSSFRVLGVSSFDSASYLRKAWLRSDQNYLAPEGDRWYGAIRVPISSSKRMRESAAQESIPTDQLREMELRCLIALTRFDGTDETHREVVEAVNEYGPLLVRRGEDNHFIEKHNAVLTDRPWENCRCPLCRDLGIDVVVFRGAGRNKRRGFHNTWVLYHKILHGRTNAGGKP
jgi:hypothetical protein